MKLKDFFSIPDPKYSVVSIIKWLWAELRGHKLQMGLNATLGILSVVLSLLQVAAVKHAVDVATGSAQGSVYTAVGIMALLTLLGFGIDIFSVWVRNVLGIKAQNQMQQQTLDRLLRSIWNGKERMHSGDVLNRLEQDVPIVIGFITETLPTTLSTITLFVGAFIYLYALDPFIAIITVAIIPIFILISRFYFRKMRSLTSEVRKTDSKVQSLLQETIQNRMLIKTLEGDTEMVQRLGSLQTNLRNKVINRTKFSVTGSLILNLGFTAGYLVAFLWAALRVSAGTLTFGGLTAFLQLVNRIQSPARSLTKLAPAFVSVVTSADRLMEIEDTPLEHQGTPIPLQGPCGIKLEHVSYNYSDGKNDVISQLDFDFRPGSCTAITGETGAGKTTLIRMILALLSPTQGHITIYNNRHQYEISPLLRCNLVYVPQGNTLLSGSIRENLKLGKLDATDEEMIHALHDSCADFVLSLPNGLDTICGEDGAGLSEGQAQRIAIARALLRNRPIMLFDEATSALDIETEQQLLHNILDKNHKTVIFITHRLAVTQYCDSTLHIKKI